MISITLCSSLVSYFLNHYYFVTVLLFIGFIVGTFPQIFNEANISSRSNWFSVVILTFLIFFLSSFRSHGEFLYNNTVSSNLLVFVFGFIDAAAMVIPGISGTAIFLLIGCYPFILYLFASLPMFFMNSNFICYILFGLGLFTGIVVVSNIMNYALKHYKEQTYLCIVSFALSSILLLCVDLFAIPFTVSEFILGVVLFILGYKISNLLNI